MLKAAVIDGGIEEYMKLFHILLVFSMKGTKKDVGLVVFKAASNGVIFQATKSTFHASILYLLNRRSIPIEIRSTHNGAAT